jgi:hypothetical protein
VSVVAGIDSWSPAWYVDPDSMAARMLDDLAGVRASRGCLLPQPIAGHRVGWIRSHGMLYAEGHPSSDGLCAPSALPGALDVLEQALLDADVPVPPGLSHDDCWPVPYQREGGFSGIRRCDSTVDIPMPTQAEGLAVLAGVAAMASAMPRSQAEVRYAKDASGSVETVYLRGLSGVKILGRWYDKGLESATAARGRLIRAEDQRRYPRASRRSVTELTNEYVRGKFKQRFYPLWKASKGVTVAGPLVLTDRMADLVEAEEMTVAQACRLAGFVVLAKHGLRQPGRTSRRYRSELRDLGLVVADGAMQEVEVDLHEVLERALDGPTWGLEG